MRVRQIPIHTGSVTGKVATQRRTASIRTESTLETDFAILMNFDATVQHIAEQPVRIEYQDEEGRGRHYTPDFLVTFKPDQDALPPLLVEIKYKDNLQKHLAAFTPKFEVARQYASAQGWVFEVYTEEEIRGPRLDNIKFLLLFQHAKAENLMVNAVLGQVQELRLTTPNDLIRSLTPLPDKQALLLPALWHLIRTGVISTDLNEPLTMLSLIWPANGQECPQ